MAAMENAAANRTRLFRTDSRWRLGEKSLTAGCDEDHKTHIIGLIF
jgi:hypothetical protein